MIVVIVLAAFAVMAAAAIAGTGRLGQWQEPVNDSRKGHLPDPPVDNAFFAALDTPRAVFGYDRREVDELYEALAQGAFPSDDPRFTVRRGGYNMAFVDEVLRLAAGTHAAREYEAGQPAVEDEEPGDDEAPSPEA